jgi:hypothetical protein
MSPHYDPTLKTLVEASPADWLPRRLRLYHGVLDYRHDRLVLSVAMLLRSGADSLQLTGVFVGPTRRRRRNGRQ